MDTDVEIIQHQAPKEKPKRTRAKAVRSTTSCTECQRRKQKCDQLQPCSNCKRRFPEPVCEYGPKSKRSRAIGSGGGVPDPDRPTFVVKLPPTNVSVPRSGSASGSASRSASVPTPSTYVRKAPIPRSPRRTRRRPSGFVVKWSGIDMTTEYPVYDSDGDSTDGEYENGRDSSAWVSIQDTAGHQEDGVSTHLMSNTASPVVVATSSTVVSSDADPAGSWAVVISPQVMRRQLSQNLWHLAGPLDGMGNLPIPPTKQNAMLVHTFAKLLHHFKGSFEGVADPDNPFINDYVPWCIQSPLLAQTSLYISARSLTENQHIDQTSTMKLKGNAISTLNRYLQSEKWISDEALAGVVQFVSIEWFFGGPEVVQAHLRGLREMLRLRGGFSSSGVGALVTKVALVDDAVIAMSLDSSPILQRGPGFDFDYREPPLDKFLARFNSPLLYGPFTFSSCVEALGLHPTTASILDDMRFLITTVLNLGSQPSQQEITKLQSTAMWIHDRISKLPLELPESPAMAPASGTGRKPRTAASTKEAGVGPAPDGNAATSDVKPHSLLPHYPSYESTIASSPPLANADSHPLPTRASTGAVATENQGSKPSPPRPVSVSASSPAASKDKGKEEENNSGSNSNSNSSKDKEKDTHHTNNPPTRPNQDRKGKGKENNKTSDSRSSHRKKPSSEDNKGKGGEQEKEREKDEFYKAIRQAAPLYAHAIGVRRPLRAVCSPSDALKVLASTWTIPLSRWRGTIGVLIFVLVGILGTFSSCDGSFSSRSFMEGDEDGDGGGGDGDDDECSGNENENETGIGAGGGGSSSSRGGKKKKATERRRRKQAQNEEERGMLRLHAGFVKSVLQIGFMQMALENWEVCRETMGRFGKLMAWLREGGGGDGDDGGGDGGDGGDGDDGDDVMVGVCVSGVGS